MKTNRFWIFILSIIVVISGIFVLLVNQGGGDVANIYLNGQLFKSVDLSAVNEPYAVKTEFGVGGLAIW